MNSYHSILRKAVELFCHDHPILLEEQVNRVETRPKRYIYPVLGTQMYYMWHNHPVRGILHWNVLGKSRANNLQSKNSMNYSELKLNLRKQQPAYKQKGNRVVSGKH